MFNTAHLIDRWNFPEIRKKGKKRSGFGGTAETMP